MKKGKTSYLKLHTDTDYLNPCPAEPGYTLTANSVDPDQLASEEAN